MKCLDEEVGKILLYVDARKKLYKQDPGYSGNNAIDQQVIAPHITKRFYTWKEKYRAETQSKELEKIFNSYASDLELQCKKKNKRELKIKTNNPIKMCHALEQSTLKGRNTND